MTWYFFIEMFDHFRAFFLVVFALHPAVYVAPLCIFYRCVSFSTFALYRRRPTIRS